MNGIPAKMCEQFCEGGDMVLGVALGVTLGVTQGLLFGAIEHSRHSSRTIR